MSRQIPSQAAALGEILSNPAHPARSVGPGPQLAIPVVASICGLWLALFGCGCLVTDPITFKDDVNFPPAIIGDSAYPVGSIITVTQSGPNALDIPLTVRDENVDQQLYQRTLITKSNGYVFYTCPEPVIPPSGSVERSDVKITINKTDLNRGECNRVDIVVSSRFTDCIDATKLPQLGPEQIHKIVGRFDDTSDPSDIARARYWVWEVSNDALTDPAKAQALAKTCNAANGDSTAGMGP